VTDDLDLEGLGRIPDPFAEAVGAAVPAPASPPATTSPTRADVGKRRLVAAAAAVLFEVVWVAFVERRHDLGALPAWSIALGIAVPLGAAALALGAANGKGRLGLGAPALWLASLCTAAPLVFGALTLAISPADEDGRFWELAVRCVGVSAVLTTPPLVLVVVAFRGAFVTASTWRTAALGVACGGLAAATMSLVCTHTGGLHVVLGHGLMMLVGGGVGALLARRITQA
jgi:hypothetical protein